MKRRRRTIRHEFCETIPSRPKEGVLYISIVHKVCLHRCFCGCRDEVVTPLDPDYWAITYDGEKVYLWPSIGSGSLQCRSHYVIRNGRVRWLRDLGTTVP